MHQVGSRHGTWLCVMLAAFVVRVVAQPAAFLTGWSLLPPFEAWHSSAVPYSWLLASQVVIVGWMGRTAWRICRGAERPRAAVGRRVGAVAALYGAAMVARLLMGLTTHRGHWWFDAPLPTVFHMVIASYLGVYAHFHLRSVRAEEGDE